MGINANLHRTFNIQHPTRFSNAFQPNLPDILTSPTHLFPLSSHIMKTFAILFILTQVLLSNAGELS